MNTSNQGQDKILIQELELRSKIGWTAEERAYPQRLVLNVTIGTDVTPSAISGELAKSICYIEVIQLIQETMEHREWVLLEQAAHQLVSTILDHFPAAQSASLELRKFVVPLAKWVGVSISRSRER